MKLSIVIPTYNSEDTIPELFESLEAQECDYPWEVIIIDNGSSDNTVEVCHNYRKRFENFQLHSADQIKGCAYARNRGVEYSSGDYILFCDSDDVVGENWLSVMSEAFLKHDFIACRWEVERLNNESLVRSRGEGQTKGLMDFTIAEYLPFASGGTIGIKKSIHKVIGGFEESFKYLQDVDYCWRVQLEGMELHLVPDVVMHMRYRDNMWETFLQSVNWASYNIKLYKKFSDQGMPKYTFKQSLVTLYRFLKKFPQLFSGTYRERYIWKIGMIIGSIQGSIKYHEFLIH